MSSGKRPASNKTPSLSTGGKRARISCNAAQDTSEQFPVVTPGPETQPGAKWAHGSCSTAQDTSEQLLVVTPGPETQPGAKRTHGSCSTAQDTSEQLPVVTPGPETQPGAKRTHRSCSTAQDTSEQLPVVTPGPETQPGAIFLTKPNPKELDPQGPQAADLAATSSTEQAETDCTVKQGVSEEATDVSGTSQEDSDDDFDIVQPTLIKQLKKILDQYPDDGQILKELIQNAEDAGASNVKFLCDYHRYGTEKLHHPELDKFQGPALYAYNNETFTAEDWKGIKMLSDSIKDKDPMKVGRFGLGFKSVYHITDLPSIVSDTQVGVFDPHKQYFSDNNGERGTGHRWRFEQDRKKMDQIPDQFAPYKGIFGCEKESFSSRYSGTLFRFPLREKPSCLSDNLYSPEKVQNEHFESFQADANMVLLFLKNLESIELYIRGEEESSPRKTFEVKIADESLENVRAKRKELIDKVRDLKYGEVPSSPVSVTYPLTIECTSYEGHSKRHTYILTSYVSGGEIGSCVKQLMEAKDLSYLPWVGVAMAVEQLKTAEDPKGHLFCFLPLPMEKKSLTGLPLHVNGFFALSQNRRHLKWPTANQEEEGKELTDKALQWNKFLVKEVVPCAYADLLLHLIKMPREEVPVELFYKAWPDPAKTVPKWFEVLHPLFKQLLKCATFHTPADGGTWLKIKEAIFDTLIEDKETTKVLLNALRLANKNIVSAPQHVRDVIAEHHGDFVHITPKLVQVALRRCPSCYVNCTRSDKLLLLKYVLKDSRFEDLYDLELLPLSNGTFTKFLQKDHPSCMPIYIPSQEHAQSLLPGLDHLFLDSGIEKEIFLQLQKAGIPGNPQLQHLDENAVITLLPKSFPCDWSSGEQVIWHPGNTNQGHPSKEWLESLWRYMSLHFPNDLSKFENQPLIPMNWSGDKVTLATLCSPSGLVLQSTPLHGRLDVTVSKVLKNVGITVINELPQFVMSHLAVLGKYVHLPLVPSVLQAMVTLTSASGYGPIARQLQQQSASDKRALRVFIAKASELSDREQDLVQQLPLLETLENSGSRSSRFVAAVDISNAAPREVLPVKVFQELIDIRHEGSESLARLSRVTMLNAADLLDQIVFQDVREKKYTESDVDKLMKHVFDHFQEYKNEMPKFQQIMKTLPFITKRNGERVKPSDLFDPTVANVQNILADEDVFPHGPVYNERGTLVILRDLGLKEEKDLTACDVLKSVHHIENMLPPENARRKACAILEHLNSNIRKMLDTVDGQTLGTWLRDLHWVPTMMVGRPPSYPENLPFCGFDSTQLLKPTQMKSSKFVNVIGSVKPVVAIKDNNFLTIADSFDWAKAPDTKDVITHLKKVIECYTQTEKPTYMIIVKEIYQHLLNLDSSERIEMLSELHAQKWIWNGDGFSFPSTIICEKASIDLAPYVCPLPSEVTEFKDVFIAGGMRNESEMSSFLQVLELMKEKYDEGQNHTRADVKHDLQLSIAILNELKPCLEDCPEDVKVRLLIPTHVVDDSSLHLAPIHECTYCDAEWLKQGHDASDVDENGEVRIMYVHCNIPTDTAETIGVPSLMSRMLDADEFDVGEEFGQEEPLTRSIHRLLEGYTDGFAVPKELIQNADDAGATEVKFLYDERTNEDFMTCLFDKGMEACQGPALWAYNNAVFTDDDFTNITKLNGATKERDTNKIGRFGSGFNAVYNLTDVPSFVSRNNFVIFDPHKTHLGKAVQNGKPGIKINLQKNKQKLRKLANQFKPFNGIFGCDLRSEAGQDSYDGTLFRFPLRTKEQAVKSELKDLHYTDQEMRKLLNKLVKGAELLLLFTQTVSQVSVYHLSQDVSGKPQPILKLFEVRKSPVHVIRDVSLPFVFSPSVRGLSDKERDFAKQSSFLRASSHALKSLDSPEDFPRSSMLINVQMKHTEDGANFFGLDEAKSSSCPWLVSSAMGTASALQFAKKDQTLVPTAGVAVRLLGEVPGPFLPEPIMDLNHVSRHSGKLFCYLPLPVDIPLPVHVNGFFALASNRRHLKEKTEDDKHYHQDEWNKVLMEDAVSEAYISALEDLKLLLVGHQESCCIYDMWPRTDLASSMCQPIVKSFYSRLAAAGPNSPRLFPDGDNWASIDEVLFLEHVLRSDQKVGNIAFQVLRAHKPHSKVVVDLPFDIMKSFIECGCQDAVKKRSFSSEDFYHDIFLPNITEIPLGQRDPLTLYALHEDNLRALLMDVPCIPASPDGGKLKRPRELVHPRGAASFLYSPEDGRFPCGTKDTYLGTAVLEKLTEELGMWNDYLDWKDVIERAQSVQKLNRADHEGAVKRTKALIQFLDKKLTAEEEQLLGPIVRESLVNAKFLPILSKPYKFPLRWAGEEYGHCALLSPKDVFQKKEKNLVSCTWPILNDCSDGCGSIPDKVEDLLGFKEKTVCLDDVKAQLKTAIASECRLQSTDSYKQMGKILHSIYVYLQEHLDLNREEIIHFLAEKKFILGETCLLCAKQVAFKFEVDCPPYLFKLPRDLTLKFCRLMSVAGVRPSFDVEDYVRTLKLLKETFGGDILDDDVIKQTVALASLIHTCVKRERVTLKSDIYLPDTQNRLYLSSELCMNDCYWMSEEEGVKYVHPMIPQETCIHLRVNTRREKTLRNCSVGISFGQREKLTTRLKSILKAYPCEEGLLKELLQNADDAQATELCFIKDLRYHGDERVFGNSWKPLQGPALCVYNNKPFSKEDIAGIQNLGEGSKGDDPNKTGQYGVGFNAVYHLTDAPSFLSKGTEIGEVLCVFDPQCKYVPGATTHEPGRKFIDIRRLRRDFTDVFSCYLETHFPLDNSTMFRFPLRTETMAEESDICTTPRTTDDLESMMNKFESETFEALLFVKSVREITLCEVSEDGALKKHYEVKTTLSENDARRRTEFSKYVASIGKQLKEKKRSLSEVPMKEVSYVVDLEDNRGYHEKWLVVQRIGFETGMVVSKKLLGAFRAGDLTLLPYGGVASLLEPSCFQTSKPKKAFCFLPLPFKTGLPVHVNGHFALDDARRNLWQDDGGGGYRSDWNNSLLRWVIAPCYVSLLATVRGHLQLSADDNGTTALECENSDARSRIATYLELFPLVLPNDTYWVKLSREVYQYVDKNKTRLLPVLRTVPSYAPSQSRKDGCIVEITWLPVNGQGKDKAFFNNLAATPNPSPDRVQGSLFTSTQNERLKNILLGAGFNLVESSLGLYLNFVHSHVAVNCLSPGAVLTFFGTYSSCSVCRVGKLPQSVQGTPFEDVNSVVLLLKYCKEDESFMGSLHGLPLLVTQDGALRVFDCWSPVFLTDHIDVLPKCASEFVHQSLRNEIFHRKDLEKKAVFKAFDVDSLAKNLHLNVPASRFCSGRGYAQWSPNDEHEIPSKMWILQVWAFLAQETSSILQNKNFDVSEKRKRIDEKLRPLHDWCLLPATETYIPTIPSHYLVSIGMADTILAFESVSPMDILIEAFRTLSLPELNCTVIDGSSVVSKCSECAKMLVATLGNPTLVLRALRRKLECSSLKMLTLQVKCEQILGYFDAKIPFLGREDAKILRMLPFYLTAHGNLTDLTCGTVYVLPETVPKEGMDVWQSKRETVFLKENSRLSRLHAFLGGTSWSEIDIYCNYIFRHFEDLDPKDQRVHLEYLRKFKLPVLEEPSRSQLLACLQELRFLPVEGGSLQAASCFYDPAQPVFKEMLHHGSFPPSPFSCPNRWLPFLRQIGLVKEVTVKHFVDFALQVAAEARTSRNVHTHKKSVVLLNHLFGRPNIATELLDEKIRNIPFIHPYKVSARLSCVYPQFGLAHNGELPYVCFEGAVVNSHESIAWTSVTLLPGNANPAHHPSHHAKYPHRLGILQEPTTEHVVSHCRNVCLHWANGSTSSYVIKKDILVAIYRFLWRHRDEVEKSRLHSVPCILVSTNGHLALPRQIVIDFLTKLEIQPYLFKAPAELGEFHSLFSFLGSSQVVTVEQYAMVLMEIQKGAGDAKLGPNELRKSFQAIKGLFEVLENADDIKVSILYLPGAKKEEPTQVFMRKSTELVFDDAPDLRDRMTGFDELLLVDLQQCDLKATNFGSLVKMLPEKFRPRMLTSLVEESLSEEVGKSLLQGSAGRLRQLLASQHFSRAIVRLIRHEDSKARRKTTTGILESVKQWLSDIHVYGIDGLKTHLLYQGNIIPGSETEKACFAEKIGKGWNVFLETAGGHERTWNLKIAEIVNEITSGLLKDTLMVLPGLLTCTPHEICPLLDDLRILEDQTSDFDENLYLPQPGTFIHIEDHHLLKDAFEDFEPGEFVGYEPNDSSMENEDDTQTFIYAVIIEQVKPKESQSVLKKKYKIDAGNDKDSLEVDAVDLYKFRRVKGAPCWEAVPCKGDEAGPVGSAPQAEPKNLQEAKDEITNFLKEARDLRKEQRAKVIKRLYLTWHPDKNPGNEEFCTRVFQYLQEEIRRLGAAIPDLKHFHGDSSSSFKNWNQHARRHRDNSKEDHTSAEERFHRANPQPGEARRWLRQAKADFKAAASDFSGEQSSYEWVCFKCHQAAEKALKAAQYSKDANKTNKHNLSLNASGLGNDDLSSLATELERLLGDSARMRYPDKMCFPKIPHDVYDHEMAMQASDYAQRILHEAQKFIESRI